VIFCLGAVTDHAVPAAPGNGESDRFYSVARAAMALTPPTDRPPAVCTVQAFSLMAIYQGIVADQDSIESTWTLMGLATKLAQSVSPQYSRAIYGHLIESRSASVSNCVDLRGYD